MSFCVNKINLSVRQIWDYVPIVGISSKKSSMSTYIFCYNQTIRNWKGFNGLSLVAMAYELYQ